ncbi:hypothetical protein BDV32DRAFT_114997 [Aspergillus pseudonomiae]|nr:hypothetical protein BDV32DRAFT_114997 [Aspergillus pseudonomiae]
MATNGPEVQSEQRQVRMFPLVACTMAKTCPGHWLAMVMHTGAQRKVRVGGSFFGFGH